MITRVLASKRVLINSGLALFVFGLFVYSRQDVQDQERASFRMPDPLEHSHRNEPEFNSVQQEVADSTEEKFSNQPLNKEHVSIDDNINSQAIGGADKDDGMPDIWVTMGLCWSNNTHYWGKDKFPYKESAPLSSRLWMKVAGVRVVLTVVYSEPEPDDELIAYKADLEAAGVLVKLVPRADGVKCVLEAQLIRMLAYLYPEISNEATVVTADVDAFPMTKQIIGPLVVKSGCSIWLYRYGLTLGAGNTFMMPFIGGKSHVWRKILEYDYMPESHSDIGQGIPKWIEKYKPLLNFGPDYTWEVDQKISSRAIMKSGLCSLPPENKLWKEINIEPRPEFDDSKTCWHGSGIYEDCNNKLNWRNAFIRHHAGFCMWWHFYPDERYPALESKYKEIVDGKQESGILNSLIGAARKFELDNLGHVLGP